MQKRISLDRVRFYLSQPACRLCISWFTGLLLGTVLAVSLDDSFSSMMRPMILDGVSILRQLISVCLPFLIAAYAVSIDKPGFLHVLCFLKAIFFSLCGFLIFSAYGTAGWLVRFLLQFADIFSTPLLLWYCLRNIRDKRSATKDLCICALLAAVIVCIDHFGVLPIVAELIDFSMGRYAYSCWI